MILGRIVGHVTSTIKHPAYDHKKQLIVDLIDQKGVATGGYLIALDLVGAGIGQTVLIIDEGNSARQLLNAPNAPIRSVVVGIVDNVHLA